MKITNFPKWLFAVPVRVFQWNRDHMIEMMLLIAFIVLVAAIAVPAFVKANETNGKQKIVVGDVVIIKNIGIGTVNDIDYGSGRMDVIIRSSDGQTTILKYINPQLISK